MPLVLGYFTIIAQGLNHQGKFGSFEPHFLGGSHDLTTLAHTSIIDTKGAFYKYPYHKQIFFTFPNVGHKRIANKANWYCDGMVFHEEEMV